MRYAHEGQKRLTPHIWPPICRVRNSIITRPRRWKSVAL